ncbi:MAG: sulfotransferase domain-containing protein [Rhodothermales bacterium]
MRKAFINSLPKSGTHLTAKCLKLMGYSELDHLGSAQVISPSMLSKFRRMAWYPFSQGYLLGIDTPVEVSKRIVRNRLKKGKPNTFFTAHVGYSTALLDAILEHGIAPIVVHRDPRAVLVSFVHYVTKLKEHVLHSEFKDLSEEQKFQYVLEGHRFKKAYLEPLRTRCLALDGWLSSDQVLKIRFEDLVGSKGGGTIESQEQTVSNLCQWLEIPESKSTGVADELFGPGRHTFRKGQVDSWRNELSDENIKLLEDKLGDVLQRWGYAGVYNELEV